jgi:hypothetical protein
MTTPKILRCHGNVFAELLPSIDREIQEVKVQVTLRPTISRRLGVRRPSGTRYQFFYLFQIFF